MLQTRSRRAIASRLLALLVALSLLTVALPMASAARLSYGDIDDNNSIDAADALIALQSSVSLRQLTADETTAADVSGDQRVDSYDALLILQFSVELITVFPVEEMVPQPAHTLSALDSGSWELEGYINDKIHYVDDNQLRDPEQWAVFVNQFRTRPDSADNGWRGEFWGKMMRGAAITYQYTQDEELYQILTDTVRDLLSTQDELGRIATYTADAEFRGWDMWCRKYVMLGLQYYSQICKENSLKEQITTALTKHADYILAHVGPTSDGKIPITETSDQFGGINSSSILEPMLFLYRMTGEQRFLDFSAYIIESGGAKGGSVYQAAIDNVVMPYRYSSSKAYELTSFFEGVAEYYLITGTKDAYTAAINYYRAILRSDRTIVGSLGINGEMLSNAAIEQSNPNYLGHKQETCVTVTWMKFCYRILQLTGDSTVADELERSIYNAMLGSVLPVELHNHIFDSYSPMMYQARKNTGAGGQTFAEGGVYGCCEAIGSAGTGLIPAIATMKSENGLAVNLYIPGTVSALTPQQKPVLLKTETGYPVDGDIQITLSLNAKEAFDVLLRIPAWSQQTVVKVGSEEIEAIPGEYLVLHREWKNGDTITLSLDMRTRVIRPAEGSKNENSRYHVALERGPLVLARDARLDNHTVIEMADVAASNGYTEAVRSSTANFDHLVEMEVPLRMGAEPIHVVDYMSAGTTGTADSMLTVWIPYSDYWTQDFEDGPVAVYCAGTERLAGFNEEGVLKKSEIYDDVSSYDDYAMQFIKISEFYYAIKSLKTGLYATVESDGQIYEKPLNQSDKQLWRVERVDLNSYRIINKATGSLLSEAGSDESDPDRIHMYPDCNVPAQFWCFFGVDYTLPSEIDLTQPVLTFSSNANRLFQANNQGILVTGEMRDKAQPLSSYALQFTEAGDGFYRIQHLESGMLLTARASGEAALAGEDGSDAQLWKVSVSGDRCKLQNKQSGAFLIDSGKPGQALSLSDDTAAANQEWVLENVAYFPQKALDLTKPFCFYNIDSNRLASVKDGVLQQGPLMENTENVSNYLFRLEEAEGGYRIQSLATEKYLTAEAKANTVSITSEERMDSPLQIWSLIQLEENRYKISLAETSGDIVFLISEDSGSNRIQIYNDCNVGPQFWVLENGVFTGLEPEQPDDPVEPSVDFSKPVTLTLKSDGLACTVMNGKMYHDVALSDLSGTDDYQWQFEAGPYGYLIRHIASGQYLAVTPDDAHEIILRDKDEEADQWWKLTEVEQGVYKIQSAFYPFLLSDKADGIFHYYPDASVDAQLFVIGNVEPAN